MHTQGHKRNENPIWYIILAKTNAFFLCHKLHSEMNKMLQVLHLIFSRPIRYSYTQVDIPEYNAYATADHSRLPLLNFSVQKSSNTTA